MISNKLLRISNKVCRFGEQRRCFADLRKRFYKEVSVTRDGNKYEINLDGRKLKTPTGNVFTVDSEPLAHLIANEWNSQTPVIRRDEMHLTSLSNTVLDNPLNASKQSLADKAIDFLSSDTLCFRTSEPVEFLELQKEKWDPLVDWFKEKFECNVNVTDGIISSTIDLSTKATLSRYLQSYNIWTLTGFVFVVENLKSLILSLALLDKRLNVEEAVNLSRLEVAFQTKKWGSVEWAHDLDVLLLKSRVSAGLLFAILNAEITQISSKKAKTSLT